MEKKITKTAPRKRAAPAAGAKTAEVPGAKAPPAARAPRTAAARARVLSSDEIFERLLVAIMEHRLPPGTQLVEARLASIFKVSRTKVREAIGRLVHDCIATNIPNRGAFVSSPTVTQAQEVFAARRLIEPALVRDVARSATKEQIATLRQHLAKESAAQKAGNARLIITLSGEFHFLIADMAGNSFLARTLRELETLSALIIILFGTPNHQICPGDHPALADAIEAHDPERAAGLMVEHLNHVEGSIRLHTVEDAPDTLEAIFS
ncbi:MAG: GntR family transcriptional regulator [Pseudomonadota bacterium]